VQHPEYQSSAGSAPQPPETNLAAGPDRAAPAQAKRSAGRAAGIGAALLAFLAKFKTVVLFLAKFKFLASGLSLVASIWAWSMVFGWAFAAGFVALIFVHEMGHVLSLRANGIKASVPIFVPFVGAYVAMKEMPRNAAVEAEVALAGPILGTAGAAVCYLIGLTTRQPIWYALASAGFFINLFNLVPIVPLDGGRVVAAISPKLWAAGAALLLALALIRPGPWLLYIGLMVALSFPRIIAAFKGTAPDDPYYTVAPRARAWTALQYFGLAALLAVMWHVAGAAVQPITYQ
jgi:Zn-dependent protease